jgi:hypothetical protein
MTFDDLMRERERVLKSATTDSLLTSLLLILAEWTDEDMPSEVRMIHAWLIEELEYRVPEIVPLIQKQIGTTEHIRYGQMIVLAVGTVLDI